MPAKAETLAYQELALAVAHLRALEIEFIGLVRIGLDKNGSGIGFDTVQIQIGQTLHRPDISFLCQLFKKRKGLMEALKGEFLIVDAVRFGVFAAKDFCE